MDDMLPIDCGYRAKIDIWIHGFVRISGITGANADVVCVWGDGSAFDDNVDLPFV